MKTVARLTEPFEILKHVFEHVHWGVAVATGMNPTLDMLNPAFAQLHGFTPEELVGKPIADLYAPERRNDAPRHAQIVAETGHHVFESVHMRKDGSTFPVLTDASAVRDDAGNVLYRAVIVQDISARRRMEEELLFKNAILSTQQEVSLDGILVVDASRKIVLFNKRFASLWKIPDEILASRDDGQAIKFVLDQLRSPESFLDRVKYLYDHPGQPSRDEIELRDGRFFDRYSSPMTGQGGEYFGRVWFFRDVTEQREADRALKDSEDRLASILESAMDAIITFDQERRIVFLNAAAEKVLRCSASEMIGNSFDRFLSRSLREFLSRSVETDGTSGEQKHSWWATEGVTAIRTGGDEFPIEATLSKVRRGEEELRTIILRDVNERREAEARLRKLEMENIYLQEEVFSEFNFGEIVGTSAALREALDRARKVAVTDSTALLIGETGTGKELIARAIHGVSGRKEKTLITVNCAALPGGLIESELFGHEKGAFTGALKRKIGRFELADSGTIFLDEIGDLPFDLQSKLLRVLQEGQFERVGSSVTLKVDVRVIAATHLDLRSAVNSGRFRADLFYRLNVFPIRIPPLRDREDDVALLARHFVMKHSTKMGKRIETIPEAVVKTLRLYDWPGNVRELQNVIERAVILSGGPILELGDWPRRGKRAEPVAGPMGETLADVEKHHILKVLESVGWRVSGERGAAIILGLKPTTLESRMKKLGIKRPQNGTPR